jgi:hypothetical protein
MDHRVKPGDDAYFEATTARSSCSAANAISPPNKKAPSFLTRLPEHPFQYIRETKREIQKARSGSSAVTALRIPA